MGGRKVYLGLSSEGVTSVVRPMEDDLEAKLLLVLGELYGASLQDDHANRLLVAPSIEIEEYIALENEPSSLISAINLAALVEPALAVDRSRRRRERDHVLLVYFHFI